MLKIVDNTILLDEVTGIARLNTYGTITFTEVAPSGVTHALQITKEFARELDVVVIAKYNFLPEQLYNFIGINKYSPSDVPEYIFKSWGGIDSEAWARKHGLDNSSKTEFIHKEKKKDRESTIARLALEQARSIINSLWIPDPTPPIPQHFSDLNLKPKPTINPDDLVPNGTVKLWYEEDLVPCLTN